MKFLVIGLGSMGKRRVRNLQRHGESNVIGFDIRADRSDEASKLYGIRTFTKFEEAVIEKPDVFVISCPPNEHLKYAHYAVDNNIHFFSEVNTDSPHKLLGLVNKIRGINVVAAPSCTMRYHPCVIAIKKLVERGSIGRPLLLTYHSGENLEDWHPWEKITDYYVGKKETGGGRDAIAPELEWIRWIMGEVKSVSAITTKLSKTDADIYDVYNLTLEFKDGSISNVLVDMIQRPPNRIFRLVCENGLIHWDWMTHTVRSYNVSEKKWEEIPDREGYKGYLVEEMYEGEMKRFIRAVKNEEQYPITFENELGILEIVYAAEKSFESGRKIEL